MESTQISNNAQSRSGGIFVSGYEEITILVVDDTAVDRALVGGILQKNNAGNLTIHFAESGEEALEMIEAEDPDIVLTDLRMPGIDGLELVKSMRADYPFIPCILMTGHGSEEIAAEALQQGAACYVPKKDLIQKLASTLIHVLASAHHERVARRFDDCWHETTSHFTLANDASLIGAVTGHVQSYLQKFRSVSENELVRLGVALDEALRNAMFHGNLQLESDLWAADPEKFYAEAERRQLVEPYRERTVDFTLTCRREEVRFVVRDRGAGFNVEGQAFDPTDPMQLTRPSGRGLFLIRTFMDEVNFNEVGNEITMIFRPKSAVELAFDEESI
ncbi:response regulator [Bremerella alba]|uniref:Chemotaxis response regulator protein-glutamate methylesterase n=1 Tax=Bremerella alba TaxID=980252 RepID=A0A7V8V7G1_9BACT|nr:response regulator [Bremerella alba]MBA2116281.1 Chemotaxis response regulator protein-glutamate methylesterase [Bremerella alba]